MKHNSIRTSIDVPQDLHRRLQELAARKGCSARQIIIHSIERAVEESEPRRPRRRLSLDPPIVRSTGKQIDLTSDRLYELVDFP